MVGGGSDCHQSNGVSSSTDECQEPSMDTNEHQLQCEPHGDCLHNQRHGTAWLAVLIDSDTMDGWG